LSASLIGLLVLIWHQPSAGKAAAESDASRLFRAVAL
jgi:hypothetical protein